VTEPRPAGRSRQSGAAAANGNSSDIVDYTPPRYLAVDLRETSSLALALMLDALETGVDSLSERAATRGGSADIDAAVDLADDLHRAIRSELRWRHASAGVGQEGGSS
jgi:hypothetical protein